MVVEAISGERHGRSLETIPPPRTRTRCLIWIIFTERDCCCKAYDHAIASTASINIPFCLKANGFGEGIPP
jgi:hypothetical protein